MSGLSKNYQGLRPLRIQALFVAAAERVAILGLDRAMAEVFVNLATGATLPDEGVVTVFGRPTSSVVESTDWLAVVDRFGIVSERSVVLEALTVVQNLAMPFTLDIDPPPEDVRQRAAALAREMSLPDVCWTRPAGELDREGRARLRAARALAFDPEVLLLEHATAGLPVNAARRLGSDLRSAAARRSCAVVALTADAAFAAAVADRVFAHAAASGALAQHRGLLDRLFRR
jgi:ABC-type multidrug transport system ATPase subunit